MRGVQMLMIVLVATTTCCSGNRGEEKNERNNGIVIVTDVGVTQSTDVDDETERPDEGQAQDGPSDEPDSGNVPDARELDDAGEMDASGTPEPSVTLECALFGWYDLGLQGTLITLVHNAADVPLQYRMRLLRQECAPNAPFELYETFGPYTAPSGDFQRIREDFPEDGPCWGRTRLEFQVLGSEFETTQTIELDPEDPEADYIGRYNDSEYPKCELPE